MTWTGNEDKTQALWVILPCHTLLRETSHVYETALLTERPLNVIYFTVQIQKHTFGKLSNLAPKTIPEVELWHTPRIHSNQSEPACIGVKPISYRGGGHVVLLLGHVPDEFYTVKPVKAHLTVFILLIG